MVMTLMTLALLAALELLSWDSVGSIIKKKGGMDLYLQGVAYNIINTGIFGPMLYELVSNRWMSPPFTAPGRLAMVLAIVVGHSIGYYCAHRAMHMRSLYWAHRFHHRFNMFVVPVTANAVSIAEFAIAYMLPFIVGAQLLRPDRMSMFIAVGIVSLNNLLIHTPLLADASAKLVPWLFVSTADHMDHHKRLTTHYAAPTISVDRMLACVFGKPASWNKQFDAAEQLPEGATTTKKKA
jgi:sterol desaturase/sphingolipid hydroxylase (fatty acid hydroxylase superfamily)